LLAEIDPSRPGAVYSLSPVYAPVSGTVSSAPGTVGSTVSTATAIMTIASGGDIEIEALVPERETGQLRTGLRADVRLDAFPGETFAAYISGLSPVVDPVSRTKKATLRFDRDDGRINAGMFARIKLNTRTWENVVAVNSAAVIDSRGVKAVYVVDDALPGETPVSGAARRVELREVSLGAAVDGLVEITGGLSAGETVVVQGQQFLSDGAAVRIIARN
jgi:RND family efflux transporter MFP subunit